MGDYRDIELIGSTIRNGRIYFDRKDSTFFPMDSFGDRASGGGKGVPVEFLVGDEILHSDIRYLSDTRIGPRAGFSAYLEAVRAQEGEKLRVTRLSDRKYKIEYCGSGSKI